jgi:four helix bundle protein
VNEKKKGKGSFRSFEDLECWQACRKVRQYISKLVKNYPKDERYRIVDDMIRAARSTTHNIAEGFGRYHYQENIQFCRVSRGSLYELKDQLICSLDDGLIKAYEYEEGMELINKAIALVNGYINYLGKRKGSAVTSNE